MINASKSVKDLLHPLALSAAKIWLAKPSYDSEMYYDKSEFQICFLRGYLSMNADGQVSDELKDWNWARDGATIKLPVDEIKRLAEWAHLDKSTHWYASVGWVVWQAGYPKQAEDLLLKAVQLVCGHKHCAIASTPLSWGTTTLRLKTPRYTFLVDTLLTKV